MKKLLICFVVLIHLLSIGAQQTVPGNPEQNDDNRNEVIEDSIDYNSFWNYNFQINGSTIGSSRILPDFENEEVKILNLDPVDNKEKNAFFSMLDMEKGKFRNTVFSLRIDSLTTYFVNFLRADQLYNDFIFYGNGTDLKIRDYEENVFHNVSLDSIPHPYYEPEYFNFTSSEKWFNLGEPIVAEWLSEKDGNGLGLRLWQIGSPYNDYYTFNSPVPQTDLSHEKDSIEITIRPSLMVRQNGINGINSPFISVVEPIIDKPMVKAVTLLFSDPNHSVLKVNLEKGITDFVIVSTDGSPIVTDGFRFKGAGGIIRTNRGQVSDLYLVNGTELKTGKYELISEIPQSVSKRFHIRKRQR